ncbi:MAG: hypothetical protein J6S44_04730 [Clostridia bacterium]|nr:hypothetical protein [Clostridia bacterium]
MNRRRDSSLTSLQIPSGRTVLIDNRIDNAPADTTLLSFANRGTAEGYTVVSNFLEGEPIYQKGGVPKLHVHILLRPNKNTEHISAIGAIAACHAIERNSTLKASIWWLGKLLSEKRRMGRKFYSSIGQVSTESVLLPSGFLDYVVLRVEMDMSPAHFHTRLFDVVTRVFTSRNVSTADHVVQTFVHDFFSVYDPMMADENDPLLFWEEYKRRSVILGKRIRIKQGKKKRRGVAETVRRDGALVVRLGKNDSTVLTAQSQLLTKK